MASEIKSRIPEKLYLIKGKLYSNVTCCERGTYYGNPVLRITYSGKSIRNYNPNDVFCYVYARTAEGNFRITDVDGRIHLVAKVHIYGNNCVYALESHKGYVTYAEARNVKIESSLLNDKGLDVFDYLSALSEISRIDVGNGSFISLKQKYENVKFIFKDSLLASYCFPDRFKDGGGHVPLLIFPFGCNESQYSAVRAAMENRLSIIQGPPGTGKTQTILNIVANLLVNGKTCQIVSNNNSAVANVLEKLGKDKYGLGFLAAALGSNDNKARFFDAQTGKYPDLSSWKVPLSRMLEIKSNIKTIEKGLFSYFRMQEELAGLQERKAELGYQMQSLGEDVSGKRPKREGILRLSVREAYAFLVRLDAELEKDAKLHICTRLRARLYGFDVKDRQMLEKTIRQQELYETINAIAYCQKRVESFQGLYNRYQDISIEYLHGILYNRFGSRIRRPYYSQEELFTSSQDFLSDYPVVTSTTFSATTNINPLIPFDYLIMDEASQVDVSAGALALNSAASAVIVGDPKQLPNVVTANDATYADKVFSDSGLPVSYRFVANSFLDSIIALFPKSPVTLLREHYRCDPLIIGFCNRQFYGGKLLVMTRRNEGICPMSVIRSVKGNHARGLQNRRQAEEVVGVVEELFSKYDDIGIITPYRNQAELIRELLKEHNLPELPVSTVHKFQGRENDVIILSTVSNEVQDFIDDPHLLNVAVSRAKKKFVLVVIGNEISDSNIRDLVDYIAYYGGDVRESTIRSVFDMLYVQYSEERKKFVEQHASISQYASENIMFALLGEIIGQPEWEHLGVLFQYPLHLLVNDDGVLTSEEASYAHKSWTLLDFLLYDKTTRLPVLAIEVDGMSFHRKGSVQSKRDILKNSILKKYGVPFIRLSTDGSNEKDRIINALKIY